jgi:hypothetical protein
MQVRPYKLFGDAERAAALAAAEERIRGWERAWLPADAGLKLDCAPARELRQRFAAFEPARWARVSAAEAQWLAAHAAEADLRELALALCGCLDASARSAYSGSSELAAEAALAAWHELSTALLGVSGRIDPRIDPGIDPTSPRRGAPAAPDEECWAAGSASLAIRASIGEARLDFVSSAAWTLRLLAGRMPRRAAVGNAGGNSARLEERRQGIASQRVEVRVLAGAVELDVRAFKALQVGNVIALDARIDQPMTVVVAAGAHPTFCAAQLGTSDGRKAIALASPRE